MKSNKTQLNDIKNLNAQIGHLEVMLGSLNKFRDSFKMEFPEHTFCREEESLIKQKISNIEKEVEVLAGTFEKGVILSVDEVSKVVLDAWGRTKVKTTEVDWDSKEDDDNAEDELVQAQSVFKEACGITFEKNELKFIQYYLETNSRNDLWLVRVYLAPGMGFAYLDTGRACWGPDVEDNKKFLKSLKKEIESAN